MIFRVAETRSTSYANVNRPRETIVVAPVFSSSAAFPALSLGFTIFGEICAYVTVFVCFFVFLMHRGCLRGRCALGVFAAGIHPSRT